MNQQCKVCGEPAAGFHFGAFTCEGCKSFFGRSYNNLNSISECKNDGKCVINKKNRTACKACRLRKCLLVGMSKSGSRYGRRSNWFKIHCLLQEQQQQQQQQQQHYPSSHPNAQQRNPTSSPIGLHPGQRKDDVLLLGLDDYKNSTSPSISSPESHNSDSSVDISERRGSAFMGHPGFRPLHSQLHHPDLSALSKEMMSLPIGFHLGGMSLLPPTFLPPPSLTMFSPYHLYSSHGTTAPSQHSLVSTNTSNLLRHTGDSDAAANGDKETSNNNDKYAHNHNVRNGEPAESYTKRFYLDAILKSQQTDTPPPPATSPSSGKTRSEDENSSRTTPELEECSSPLPVQENPMDLSMKSNMHSISSDHSDEEEDIDMDDDDDVDRNTPPPKRRPAPIDLTTRC